MRKRKPQKLKKVNEDETAKKRYGEGGGGGLTQRTKHLKSGKYTKQKGEINYKLISVHKRKNKLCETATLG